MSEEICASCIHSCEGWPEGDCCSDCTAVMGEAYNDYYEKDPEYKEED